MPRYSSNITAEEYRNAYKDLKVEYDKAIEAKVLTFMHKGQEYLVSYTKYLLEFFKSQFDPEDKE